MRVGSEPRLAVVRGGSEAIPRKAMHVNNSTHQYRVQHTTESGSRSKAESDARSLGWHRKPPEPKEPKGLELIQGEGGETE